MARLLGPDMGSRAVFLPSGAPAAGKTGVVYANAAGTVLAGIATYNGTGTVGATIPGSVVTVDASGLLPKFWFPDGVDVLWITVNGGPVVPINADYDPRIDQLQAELAALTERVASLEGLTAPGALSAFTVEAGNPSIAEADDTAPGLSSVGSILSLETTVATGVTVSGDMLLATVP